MWDFTNPMKTVVEKSVKGKTYFFYGVNGTGKTFNAIRYPKPFVIAWENGLNAHGGIPVVKPTKWSDSSKIIKQLKRPEVREMYETIIVDTAEKMAEKLEAHVLSLNGVEKLSDVDNGEGYLQIGREIGKFIDGLTELGYTIIFIGHPKDVQEKDSRGAKYIRKEPEGNKRVIKAICDAVDIISYLEPSGIDEESGEVLLSTAHLVESKTHKARSRWTHMPKKIYPFSVENMTKALEEAIEKEEQLGNPIDFVDKIKVEIQEDISFDEIKTKIEILINKMKDKFGGYNEYLQISEEILGVGVKVSTCNSNHSEVLLTLIEALEEKLK